MLIIYTLKNTQINSLIMTINMVTKLHSFNNNGSDFNDEIIVSSKDN